MSGSQLTPVEQHLGDRLAALVDGELGHDARERVLAHLATCPRCKAEANAQRRLKSVFAEAAPPPPSESLLARLQGLPGGGDPGGDNPPAPQGGQGGYPRVFDGGVEHPPNPLAADPRTPFRYAPSGPHTPVLPSDRGFRIQVVGRPESDRSASRGRRFAFAAAGAVSLAAIALGGVSTGVPAVAGGSVGSPSNAVPMRTTGPASAADAMRRRVGDPVVARSEAARDVLPQSAAPAAVTAAPLLPGMPPPPPASAFLTGDLPFASSNGLPLTPLIRTLPMTAPAPEPVRAPAPSASTAPGGTAGQIRHAAPAAPVASTAPAGVTGPRVR